MWQINNGISDREGNNFCSFSLFMSQSLYHTSFRLPDFLYLFGAIVFIHLLLFLSLCFVFSVLCLFLLSFPSVLFLPLLFPGDGVNWRIRVVIVWMSKVVSERTVCLSKKTTYSLGGVHLGAEK